MHIYADGYELQILIGTGIGRVTVELSPDDRDNTFRVEVWRDATLVRRDREVLYHRLHWWEAMRVVNAEIARITG